MYSKSLAETIGTKVLDTRVKAGLTQAQLASLAGVSDRLVRQVETGKATGISLDKLSAILEALGLYLSFGEPVEAQDSYKQDREYDELMEKFLSSYINFGELDG